MCVLYIYAYMSKSVRTILAYRGPRPHLTWINISSGDMSTHWALVHWFTEHWFTEHWFTDCCKGPLGPLIPKTAGALDVATEPVKSAKLRPLTKHRSSRCLTQRLHPAPQLQRGCWTGHSAKHPMGEDTPWMHCDSITDHNYRDVSQLDLRGLSQWRYTPSLEPSLNVGRQRPVSWTRQLLRWSACTTERFGWAAPIADHLVRPKRRWNKCFDLNGNSTSSPQGDPRWPGWPPP